MRGCIASSVLALRERLGDDISTVNTNCTNHARSDNATHVMPSPRPMPGSCWRVPILHAHTSDHRHTDTHDHKDRENNNTMLAYAMLARDDMPCSCGDGRPRGDAFGT